MTDQHAEKVRLLKAQLAAAQIEMNEAVAAKDKAVKTFNRIWDELATAKSQAARLDGETSPR